METDLQPKFHDSEIAVQESVGVAELVAEFGQAMIMSEIPEAFSHFLNQLPWVIAGAIDEDGNPWAVPIFAVKGFIQTLNNTSLRVNGIPILTSQLRLNLNPKQKIAILGIDLLTRRRIRLNGRVKSNGQNGFVLGIEQCYGNCPKYIQKRKLQWGESKVAERDADNIKISSNLSAVVKALIEKSDTFFIASRSKEFNDVANTGMDISHRGGKLGFVKVEENMIYFPDFSGNRLFNTLGNIVSDGRVGLFFPNFISSEAVFIAGKAEILCDIPGEDKSLPEFAGAERMIKVTTVQTVYLRHGLEMTAELVENSPVLEATGTWR